MNVTIARTLAMLAGAAIAGGCSSLASDTSTNTTAAGTVSITELQARDRQINELESQLAMKEQALQSAEARLATNAATGSGGSDAGLFPPNPKAGECYARVLIPAQTATTTEQVLVRDAAERIEIIPAKYETVDETVMVREASTRLEVIPAVYGEVQEQVLVKPASQRIVEIPARYETVVERVIDTPAHTAWKKGPAAVQTSNVLTQRTTDTGEIMCLVEVPATYRNVERRVLVEPARTDVVEIPAEYETVTRTVVKQPETTRAVTVPAEYATMPVTRLVTPAQERRIAIPAEYETLTRTNITAEERMEWRQVMCEVNMTRDNVLSLQRALADAGYYKAGIDGIIGSQTLGAARRYAIDNNLPAGSNYIPMEVVDNLGLSL